MPPSTVPTTPSHIFVDNAITVLEEATATALDAIEEDNLLQSQLSFRGIRIEDYEKTFVALTKAEAQIIHDRENYHAAQRVQETYDLLIRGKEDPDAPAQSLYWRTRCWEIATHHSKYQVCPAGSLRPANISVYSPPSATNRGRHPLVLPDRHHRDTLSPGR